ncbi:S-phase kinase-associated protein 2 isoform X2 [Salmo salar]|uniref:S-phase kinase-associated protein 2 n=1 Tax=Salmo salar TaxID=8030 RepID=A0A1S3L332_SALSA|nr:S-phase kinase-associated protein 2 isoform X2 [Salmo salar]|eukprot:XP_013985210.1 PREDICTED: S-phase kinase-associated protein 2-like isoform X2 [Salmo salar]
MTRSLQEFPCLNENLEGSMLSLSQKNKWKKRQYFGECLDTENTPDELIQQWSPPHKQRVVCKGKENEDNLFVVARRPRTRREFSGLSWDSLPDELLLEILSCLPLQDLLRMSRVCKRWHRLVFDESLWHSVDLVGKAQLDQALGQMLTVGVLGLRCPHTCIGEPCFTHTQHLHVHHMDLSSCTVTTLVLGDIISRCRLLENLSLEGLELSDNIVQSLSQNTELVRLNLCGCSGFSPDSLSQILKSCLRLEELNLSWCDFSTDHVKAVVSNLPSNITQLNLSGYRQNLTMEDVKDLVERCPNLVHLDLSVLMKSSSFPILQQLRSLRHLALSRCYQIHPAALADFEKFPELQTLEVYGLVQDTYLPILSKGLPRLQINSRPFSGVARPTGATRRDRSMWGMTCRLVFRP